MEAAVSRAIDQIQNSFERRITHNYRDALNDIRVSLSVLYEKYASKGVLTYAEMSRYNRLKSLHDQLVEILGPVFSKNGQLVEKLTRVQYNEAFYRHAWMIDQQAGVALKWGLMNPKMVEAAVSAGKWRALRDIAIKDARGLTLRAIDRTITQGLIKGESYPSMARALKDVFAKKTYEYMRIARTEGGRAAAMGAQANYDKAAEMGIEFDEVWIASLDLKTRPTSKNQYNHRIMDGRKAEIRDGVRMFYSPEVGWIKGPLQSGVPGFDINCRCTTRSEIKGYPPAVRRIRDEGVQPYKTYTQWAQEKGIKVTV